MSNQVQLGIASTSAGDTVPVSATNPVPTTSAQAPAALGQAAMAASLPVVIASNQSTITVQQAGYSFQNITTATTTTVKSGAGVLRGVTVNTKGTIASTIVIYDNIAGSGTIIGTIDSLNLAGQFVFDVAFATGLTLVTTGTVAPDITVSYR